MAEIIPAGKHRARALEGALGETSGGKEQVVVAFQLLDLPGTPSIYWYGYFTDKTTESTFRALRTAGWKGMDLSDLSDLQSPDVPEVILVVEHERDDKGTLRAKVRWVNGMGGLALKQQLEPAKAKTFAQRMKGQLAHFDAMNGGRPPGAATPAPARRPAPAAAGEVPQEVLDAQEGEASGSTDLPF